MKKQRLLKTLLVTVGLLIGTSVWGAGYTRTLTNALSVAGYKAKALYDFQNNSPAVLPTSGDLRYRAYENGGYWGLHNYGGGSRSATATIPVAAGDILVLQLYNASYVPTINRGSQNATLTAANDPYFVYDITTAADDITITVPRYGGVVAALVMEVDNDVETASYTINYKSGGSTIYSYTPDDEVAVGTTVYAESYIWKDDVKYLVDDGQTTSMTIASGTNVLDVNVTAATLCAYTINAKNGDDVIEVLGSGSVYAGENTLSVPVKVYYNIGGTLYGQSTISYGGNTMSKKCFSYSRLSKEYKVRISFIRFIEFIHICFADL